MTELLSPFLMLLIVVASDLWVFADAKRAVTTGAPVFLRVGRLSIDTPVGWLVACVVFWILFFPLYLLSRSRS